MLENTLNEIKEKAIKSYKDKNDVKVHITKLDYPNDKKYNTLGGIWINNELNETFELENMTNNDIDSFLRCLKEEFSQNTLYII